MKILFFKTNTTRPVSPDEDINNLKAWPWLTHLEWLIHDDNEHIPTETGFIFFSPKKDNIKYALIKFLLDAASCDFLVSANLKADYKMVGVEMKRNGITTNKKSVIKEISIDDYDFYKSSLQHIAGTFLTQPK